jgi:hypothetical protein
LHQSDRGTAPDEATPDGNDSLYCFNFLTQRAAKNIEQTALVAIKLRL